MMALHIFLVESSVSQDVHNTYRVWTHHITSSISRKTRLVNPNVYESYVVGVCFVIYKVYMY